jgi:dihydrofolate synthase / folylpolyglutamate synthase
MSNMTDREQEHLAAVMPPFAAYQDAVDWIVGRVSFGIKPGLDRIEALMERFGHPHRRLKFIHVAGTNGKGSTCAFLSCALQTFGYDVGVFTSPYIEKFTNRIKYNGQDIPEDELLRLTNLIKPHVDEISDSELGSVTMFEICTAITLLYFGKVVFPDYVVWETGLGGKLDVTNLVTPIVSVITNVGHDHMDILGNSLEEITVQKAGIIKSGVPVVSAVSQPEVIEIIRNEALSKKSALYLLGDQFRYEQGEIAENLQTMQFYGPFRSIPNVALSLNGSHQQANAAVALMTLEVLRQFYALIIEEDDLYRAFKMTSWPGRLEMVAQDPRILLDGAHNPEGAEALAVALKEIYSYKKLHFLIGMVSKKNHYGYLRHILPLVDTLIVTEPDIHRKESAEQLAAAAEEIKRELGARADISVEADWKKALRMITDRTEQADLAVVSGTLYLISDVRSWILYATDSEKGW